MIRLLGLAFTAILMTLATALAHTGIGDTSGFNHGFTHPISGIDHIVAMVAVGLFATHLGGRALWLVPLSFVSMMAVGSACGTVGVNLPLVEIGIGLSVVVFGIMVAYGLHIPTVAAMALVGFLAIFHGHAHGAEMPESVSGLEYGAGFVLATALLHGFGIGSGLLIGRMSESDRNRVCQAAGSATALIGVALLTGVI